MKAKEPIFKGSGVALITPFDKNFEVDYAKLKELLDFHLNNNTDAIIITGTTGEASTLSNEEHLRVIEETIKHINGRIPVVAGTGSNDTRHCIHMSKRAIELGADALLLVTPYYNKTSQAGLIAHYTEVAKNVENTPIILYNVPGRTGMTIEPETYLSLSQIPNVVATKEACGNMEKIKQIVDLCSEYLDVYSGNDEDIADILDMGGLGVISVMANVLPEMTHYLSTPEYMSKDERQAEQERYLPLVKALFSDVSPMPIKEAMNMLGMNVGECRLPLIRINEEKQMALKKTLSSYPNFKGLK